MTAGRWRHGLLAAAALLLAGCSMSALNRIEGLNPSSLTEHDSDIARTFDRATLALPGRGGMPAAIGGLDDAAVARALAALPAGSRLPTVVYMHGCTGLLNLEPVEALADAGFAVIAPDSFARRYRPLQCHPSRQSGGDNVFVYDFRLAEISYALDRIQGFGWIDRDRLFLFGVSEGGVAAALYRGRQFRARVITQWTCHGDPFIRGIAAPPGEPVLAVVRADDPWYDPDSTANQQGDCGAFFGTRPDSRSIVLPGNHGHDVFDDPAVLPEVIGFLRRHLG